DKKIAYRETIRKSCKIEGKHKKQSGGHGQYGHVKIEFSPGEAEGLTFTETIFGGSVPKNFHPAVEKGLQECMSKGVLAGYPVVNLAANLFDGSYHDVDSSEMAFKLAAGIAFRDGLPLCNPVLLEPVGALRVLIPDSQVGDVIGDLNKRRGKIMGMDQADGKRGYSVVEAEVPDSEMSDYVHVLRAISQGRGSYTFYLTGYSEVPGNIAEKIIAEAKKNA
ncbi:MAG: elongation factor G, partial [Clostridia bacterium]|nr:elongation factor G [Clostridia bacterium]